MKIVFMGTPEFSVPILEGLYNHHEILAVVTQPDKPVGRKQALIPSPVKAWALNKKIQLFQPKKIKEDYDLIKNLNPELIVSAAYGQFVGMELLNHPIHRSINVHASLLPKYRGGAPIQEAIKAGDTETGVSIIYMEKKMDAGDILATQKILIEDNDTGETLFHKLSLLGRDLVLKVIDDIEHGRVTTIPQDDSKVTFAYNITKEQERIDFSKSAKEVRDHVRAYYPNPGTYTFIAGDLCKILHCEIVIRHHDEEPGSIIEIMKDRFIVACGNQSCLAILTIQPQGKKPMPVRDYLNGNGKEILKKVRRVGE